MGLDAARIEGGDVAAEAHEVEDQLRRVARRHVGELLNQQMMEPTLQRGEDEWQRLGDEAGARAGAVERGAPLRAGSLNAPACLGVESGRVVELAARRDHVHPGFEQPAERVDVHSVSHVEHAIGLQGKDLRDVTGGQHPGGRHAAELARVAPRLVLRVDVQADEVEVGMRNDGPQGVRPDVPGRPLHDRVAIRVCHGTRTGSFSHPRTVEVRACTAFAVSTSHSGNRLSTSSNATRASRRARCAPRQKCKP